MSRTFRLALAQLNLTVGDVPGNAARVQEAARKARDELGAQAILFPELTLTGYPPEDLLYHAGLRRQVEEALARLVRETRGIALIVGHPEYVDDRIHNALSVIEQGSLRATYRKQLLPNYRVFDEKRYFQPGCEACVVTVAGFRLGLTICEDLWWPGPAEQAAAAGAELIVNVSASPYEIGKQMRREQLFAERARAARAPLAVVNHVCGQDELVFEGNSFVLDVQGELMARLPESREAVEVVEFVRDGSRVTPLRATVHPLPSVERSVYGALVLGIRDYVHKNGFKGALLGLSGGIDSALTLALAADALGAPNVTAVMMPSRYTSDLSLAGAEEEARALGVAYHVIPIEKPFGAFLDVLEPVFAGLPRDTTEENIQARCRGVILMAISNKTGRLVLATGNKSEMAVGYATLYGDMAGGFAPLRDVYKTLVYRLAHDRNAIAPVIPAAVIARAPSAELAPGQTDQDTLPPYEVLDAILEAYIEDDLTVRQIVTERGFDEATVKRVVRMVQRAEYKRRQGPPGVLISRRAFGRDRRYPITSGYDPTKA
ncbi:MAG TPA: NAD+ synthase [Gammaproteobacteria bacterium]|nr:NAD+ synthase [Gammaproteobacteria bacterium]